MRQASCMKPEAQVPSEGSLFQSSCLPSSCAVCPHNRRDWGGAGKVFSFLHLHRFSWRQLMGLVPDLSIWDILTCTTVETGFPHCWSASFGKWTGHCLQHFEEVSKDTPHFQWVFLLYTESNRLPFLKILSICWIQQCTFGAHFLAIVVN